MPNVKYICRLQEIIGEDQKESGRIPRTIDCDLTNDLGKVLTVYL